MRWVADEHDDQRFVVIAHLDIRPIRDVYGVGFPFSGYGCCAVLRWWRFSGYGPIERRQRVADHGIADGGFAFDYGKLRWRRHLRWQYILSDHADSESSEHHDGIGLVAESFVVRTIGDVHRDRYSVVRPHGHGAVLRRWQFPGDCCSERRQCFADHGSAGRRHALHYRDV